MTTPPDGFGRRAHGGRKPAVALCGSGRLDTHVYIDGFNLYYGLLRGTPYKWLDLERFCDQLLPRNTVRKIYYFTAHVDARPYDPDQPTRQLAYLSALATLPRVEIHLGTFMSSVVSQVVVQSDPATGRWLRTGGRAAIKAGNDGAPIKAWILKSEEKGSDVNLAAHLLRDAYRGACACAAIVSNDSDLLTPIRMAKVDCGITIGLVPPRAKGSVELKRLADFKIDPRIHLLASSQFPDAVPVPTPGGGRSTSPRVGERQGYRPPVRLRSVRKPVANGRLVSERAVSAHPTSPERTRSVGRIVGPKYREKQENHRVAMDFRRPVVEPRGIEPLTSAVRLQRSPS